jgi:hypothetical protein
MSTYLSIGECRLLLTEYFDSVTSEIDFFIEKRLQANFGDKEKSAKINKKRDILLKEVKEAEQLNLKHLNENLVNDLDSLAGDSSKLFVVFCFVLELNQKKRLIVTDEYIPEGELNLFKKLMDATSSDDDDLPQVEQQLKRQLFEMDTLNEQVKIE